MSGDVCLMGGVSGGRGCQVMGVWWEGCQVMSVWWEGVSGDECLVGGGVR